MMEGSEFRVKHGPSLYEPIVKPLVFSTTDENLQRKTVRLVNASGTHTMKFKFILAPKEVNLIRISPRKGIIRAGSDAKIKVEMREKNELLTDDGILLDLKLKYECRMDKNDLNYNEKNKKFSRVIHIPVMITKSIIPIDSDTKMHPVNDRQSAQDKTANYSTESCETTSSVQLTASVEDANEIDTSNNDIYRIERSLTKDLGGEQQKNVNKDTQKGRGVPEPKSKLANMREKLRSFRINGLALMIRLLRTSSLVVILFYNVVLINIIYLLYVNDILQLPSYLTTKSRIVENDIHKDIELPKLEPITPRS